MSDGVTFAELGAYLFSRMRTETYTSLACPFGNGFADFIGRDNNSYAKKFCARGCSPLCYFEMVNENKARYAKKLSQMEEV